MVLQTVLLRSHQVSTLELSDFDIPGPGGGGAGRVDVEADGDTGITGGDKHVLPGVVAADHRWGGVPGNTHYE